MSARYEVWLKQKMHSGRELPEDIFYTLDTAIEQAKKLSRGTYKTLHWKSSKHNLFDGENVEVELPNMYAVVLRDGQSIIRGWGIGGNFYFSTDCKRCNNSGVADDGLNCPACKGASTKVSI